MPDPIEQRAAARQRAQNYFTQADKRDALVREEMEKERAANAAKTAKLRALRLAKEAEAREEAARNVQTKAAPAKRSRRVKA